MKVDSPSLFSNLSSDCRLTATKSHRHSKSNKPFI